MIFQELKNTLQTVEDGGSLDFNLSWINSNLTEQLDDFIKIIDNIINLKNAKYSLINDNSFSVSGEILVGDTNIYFEVRMIIFNSPSDLDYLITVEPNGDWKNTVDESIKAILNTLPIDFEELIFINSSRDLEKATVVFDENKFYELGISKGAGIVTHIKSDLFKMLNLPDTLFQIAKTPEGVYKVYKRLNLESSIANIFKILIEKVEFRDVESLEVEGILTLPFPNNELNVPTSFVINKDLYQIQIHLDKNIKFSLPIFLAGAGLNLGNIEIDLQGSFIQPEFNYGLFADFAIGQEVTPRTISEDRSSLNDGELKIIYNSTSQATLIPVFLEAFAKEITLSKIVQLFAGKSVTIPDFLDQILRLYSTHFYYCAPSQNRILLNGVEAKQGIALSSEAEILGLKAYCELSSIEERTNGNIVLDPINIANLITIEGNSSGSPKNYSGPLIKEKGVQLFFDSKGPTYFRTDVIVNLFDIYNFKTGANVQENGLQFYYDIDLGFVKTQIDCLLNSIDNFKIASKFDTKLLGLKADLGVLGNLSLDLSIQCEILFFIKSQTSDGAASLAIYFNINGTDQNINLSFNVKDIRSLEDVIKNAIVDLLILLFKSAEQWLKAVLNGVIKIADDAFQESKRIAENLKNAFEQSVEDSAKLLQSAGYTVEKTTEILKDGFGQSANEIASALKTVGYTTEQIANALISVLQVAPVEVFKILKDLNEPIEDIGKALRSMSIEIENALKELALNEQDAAKLLKGLGKTVDEQARILKEVLGATRDATEAALQSAGNAIEDISEALSRVFGVETPDPLPLPGGPFPLPLPIPIPIPPILKPCMLSTASVSYKGLNDDCYELELLRYFRDNFMLKLPNGEQLIQEYYSLSEVIIKKVEINKIENEFYEKVFNELIIPSVRLIEKKRYDKAFLYYRNFVLKVYHELISS